MSVQQTIDNLQSQVIVWIIVAVAAIVTAIILVAVLLVKNWLRTKEGKTIDAAKGKRSHLIIAASLGSFAKLMKASDFNPEGILETIKFKERWKKRSNQRKIYNPPKQVEVSLDSIKKEMGLSAEPTQAQIESAELTRELVQKELNLTTEKVFFEGCRIPISVAVEDKVFWSGIKGLGMEAYNDKLEKVQRLGPKIKALLKSPYFKDVGEALEQLYNRISLVPFDLIRGYFSESYDQSNDRSQKEYHYTMGFNDGIESVKKSGDMSNKMFMYMGIAGIVGGCVIAGLALFMGGKK